ncbi:oligosaccharide flippase family protein [Stutzerimonas xanthomarina]|uniref:oligosaccharide flippase family protein n=1 Tax=Stutzerimonas xanthomarina TaxID=271420 RepID=UPI003AA81A30
MRSSIRTFRNNTGALFAIQIANYALPLLLIPYLTHTLGVRLYGLIAFGLAIVQIACIITDYGFSLSAVYQIAKQQDDRSALGKIISAVFISKLGLLVPVIGLLSIFILFQEKYADHQAFLWLLLIPIIGQTLQPTWFFQGIERMAFITLATVLSRALYLGLVILWVSAPEDYRWVAIANGFSSIAAAAIGIGMMLKLGYQPRWCNWAFLRQTLKESAEFFWSRAAVSTYTAGGAFFLGLVSTPLQVAYYSAAEQLYKGAQSLFGPLSQALYPHMAKHHNFPLFFRILKASIALSLSGLLTGALLGPRAIQFIFGPDFLPAYQVLIIFLLTFTITTPSILLGYPFLGALGNAKAANMSVIWAGIAQIIILHICYLSNFQQATHIAVTVFIVEVLVLTYRAYKSKETYKEFISSPKNSSDTCR